MTPHRIGLVVPSSNVTVETEVPALLARHADARFSFHSSRMRMHRVSPEELRAMNAQRERCVDELADAGDQSAAWGHRHTLWSFRPAPSPAALTPIALCVQGGGGAPRKAHRGRISVRRS